MPPPYGSLHDTPTNPGISSPLMLCWEQRAYHSWQMLVFCHQVGRNSMTQSKIISFVLPTRYLLPFPPQLQDLVRLPTIPCLDETLNASNFQVLRRHKCSTASDELEPSRWFTPSTSWPSTGPASASLGVTFRDESPMGISESLQSTTEPIWRAAREVRHAAVAAAYATSPSFNP